MKDLIKHLSCLLIVLLASMALPSCGDDDDEPTNEVTEKTMAEMLEGTWQWNSSYYYTFYKDGTGEWFSKKSDGTYGWRYFFNWTYNPNTQILALRFEDEDDNDDFPLSFQLVNIISTLNGVIQMGLGLMKAKYCLA